MSLSIKIEKKLKDIHLNLDFSTETGGGITGILGASGCGKSMTLKAIAGIITPDKGRIVLNGKVLFDSEQGINLRIQDRGIGYLFQNYALFPHMTVAENVRMAVKGTKAEKKELADFYLRLFRIEELSGRYPGLLSGGQQQRAALARVMASRPLVLMFDEPFSALDYSLKEMLELELLEELKTFSGDVLFVTHNRDEIYRFCQTIKVLNQGQIVASGKVKEVFQNPGTLSAARLTGCKNLEAIRHETPHRFFVPAWGVSLSVEKREVPKNAAYIGIRAHDFKEAPKPEKNNTVPCRIKALLEAPFEVTLVLENGMWWKIPKERFHGAMNRELPPFLSVPEESIFFLEDR